MRPGELTYYDRIGEAGRKHAVGKPFSDDDCGLYLMRAGALFTLLPPPPARVLDCGCGTGWLACFLARRGYDVVGTDVSKDAIALAKTHPLFRDGPVPSFAMADFEALAFDAEFDIVIFFDSLHHATDLDAVLKGAYRALRPGGMCVALEPGRGHRRKSQAIDAEYDVTDQDMPPSRVCRAGRRVGFRRCRVAPAPQHLGKLLYRGRSWGPLRHLIVQAILMWERWYCGIAILRKD
jgi:2-polyprenyl-3-methyl-5-hydroxy-6-metoxy-1,4-benzoquinol methylase